MSKLDLATDGSQLRELLLQLDGVEPMTVDVLRTTKVGVFTQKFKGHADSRVAALIKSMR